MGAIVGGLYASGRTPEELQHLVESLDWADAFDDQSMREHRPYRRKQDDAAFPIPLELGLRNGSLQMPRGLIQGQKLALILREQLLPVYDVHNFDDLLSSWLFAQACPHPAFFRLLSSTAAHLSTAAWWEMSR
jgi:NTE family protein